MKVLATLQSWLPELHNFTDEERRHHIGFTWHGKDGLRDSHDLELRYTYNSERLALQGSPRPDGSWAYTEPNGRVHTISAERARAFMQSTPGLIQSLSMGWSEASAWPSPAAP
jgi:hypothetical protein